MANNTTTKNILEPILWSVVSGATGAGIMKYGGRVLKMIPPSPYGFLPTAGAIAGGFLVAKIVEHYASKKFGTFTGSIFGFVVQGGVFIALGYFSLVPLSVSPLSPVISGIFFLIYEIKQAQKKSTITTPPNNEELEKLKLEISQKNKEIQNLNNKPKDEQKKVSNNNPQNQEEVNKLKFEKQYIKTHYNNLKNELDDTKLKLSEAESKLKDNDRKKMMVKEFSIKLAREETEKFKQELKKIKEQNQQSIISNNNENPSNNSSQNDSVKLKEALERNQKLLEQNEKNLDLITKISKKLMKVSEDSINKTLKAQEIILKLKNYNNKKFIKEHPSEKDHYTRSTRDERINRDLEYITGIQVVEDNKEKSISIGSPYPIISISSPTPKEIASPNLIDYSSQSDVSSDDESQNQSADESPIPIKTTGDSILNKVLNINKKKSNLTKEERLEREKKEKENKELIKIEKERKVKEKKELMKIEKEREEKDKKLKKTRPKSVQITKFNDTDTLEIQQSNQILSSEDEKDEKGSVETKDVKGSGETKDVKGSGETKDVKITVEIDKN